jgi:hypothetical protein
MYILLYCYINFLKYDNIEIIGIDQTSFYGADLVNCWRFMAKMWIFFIGDYFIEKQLYS